MIHYSNTESLRFNRKIYRGSSDVIDVVDIRKAMEDKPDTIIYRVPSTEFCNLHLLQSLSNDVIIADVLVYYKKALSFDLNYEIRNAEFNYRIADRNDLEKLKPLVHKIFANYTNHYFSNPRLDKTNILEGYVEWALSHLTLENKFCVLMEDQGRIKAFAACAVFPKYGEGVLYGVDQEASGKGIYTDLIRYTGRYMANKGIELMKVSTQIQNYVVQRVWIKEGYMLDEAFVTIHINLTY